MSKEQEYKKIIRTNLENVLRSGQIAGLGEHKKGKVRDVHFTKDQVIMVASDRISSFDYILSRCIPFKGVTLNLFNQWAMENTADIIQNAALESPDPNVIIQRRLENVGFECVVRGFVWGSLAADYENGLREKSGIFLPEGMLRYQELSEPMFTPSTKAEHGHDVDVNLAQIADVHGKEIAEKLRDISIQLYQRGAELAQEVGMLFLDTKFEFGFDEDKGLWLIDESLTPDSSRYCAQKEYDHKYRDIVGEMRTGKFKDVTELLKERPELKIKEESKQFVRDVLIEGGYKEGGAMPDLTDEQVVETAWRYINSYEKLTGNEFVFTPSKMPVRERIVHNLKTAGILAKEYL